MRRIKGLMASVALLAMGLLGTVTAQDVENDRYIVYAKAGRVNYVAGSVTRQKTAADLREAVAVRDSLEAGEMVRTGAYGRVEVLLNPGSYLRANASSEFALLNTDLDSLGLRLTKGSALLEIMGPEELQMTLTVETPQASISILRRGIYRFNVGMNGTQVIVQKGRAMVGSMLVKGGNQITVGNGPAALAKFDKKSLDGFDNWSRERSASLALVNSRITDRGLSYALANMGYDSRFGRLAGVWIYDPYRNCYTFLPYSRYSWSSPYGWGYYSGLDYNDFMWYCDMRRNQPLVGGGAAPTPPSPGRVGTVISNPGPPNVVGDRSDRSPGPKVTRAEGSPARGGDVAMPKGLIIRRDTDTYGGGGSGGFDSSPRSFPRSSDSGSSSSSSGGGKVLVTSPAASSPAPRGGDSDRALGNSKKPDN